MYVRASLSKWENFYPLLCVECHYLSAENKIKQQKKKKKYATTSVVEERRTMPTCCHHSSSSSSMLENEWCFMCAECEQFKCSNESICCFSSQIIIICAVHISQARIILRSGNRGSVGRSVDSAYATQKHS